MIILKNRDQSKSIFQVLFELTFSIKLSLLFHNSISWQWLLFDLIKARKKYKQVIKLGFDYCFTKNIQIDAPVDCI